MITEKSLENIINSKSKIAIMRLFVSRTLDFKATGRRIAELTHFSAPAAHSALKELFTQGVLRLEYVGKQHIYSLDNDNQLVQKILKPMFAEESSIKNGFKDFLVNKLKEAKIQNKVVSVLLYGSFQKGTASAESDVDIAVIIKDSKEKKDIEELFINNLSVKFYNSFKAHLDVYLSAADEFRLKLKNNLPPVSTLMKSYSVIFGKEPLDI